jgi:hypothetical protein
MRRRMLGARDMTVRSSRSCTEKATSLPFVGFFTLRSTRGTSGTVVGRDEVERTAEPFEAEDLELAEGEAGVTVRMAELGDFTAEADWAASAEGRIAARRRKAAASLAIRALCDIASAPF